MSASASTTGSTGAGTAGVRRPLEGLKVVEVGIALAGPFAGSLLAELGAHVIKIEKPGGGDPMRLMGPSVDDVPVWWGVAARAKHCADLDLKQDGDKRVFRELIAQADVLVENYRPGVLDRLGLGWPVLHALNPRLVMLSISGFGQTGPMAERPGFGKIAEAMSGIVALTGNPDETPMHIGFSLADTATGLMGTLGVALALFDRDVAGSSEGTRIDVALFEPLFRVAECQLALCERLGRPALREGNNDPYGWGASGRANAIDAIQCADGHWIMVRGAAADRPLAPGLREKFGTLDVHAALALARTVRVEAAWVHDGATLATTAYFAERGDVLRTSDARAGELLVPGELPKRPSEPRLPLFRATRHDEDRSAIAWARKRVDGPA